MGSSTRILRLAPRLDVEPSAVVIARNRNGFAHLEEPRPKSRPDPIFEDLVTFRPALIKVVRGKDRQLFVVVAGINDMRHRVADPVGGL